MCVIINCNKLLWFKYTGVMCCVSAGSFCLERPCSVFMWTSAAMVRDFLKTQYTAILDVINCCFLQHIRTTQNNSSTTTNTINSEGNGYFVYCGREPVSSTQYYMFQRIHTYSKPITHFFPRQSGYGMTFHLTYEITHQLIYSKHT